MNTIRIKTLRATAMAGFAVLAFSLMAVVADAAAPGRSGKLHLIKDTSEYTGLPGGFATIAASDLAEIPVGAKIFYDQAPDIPAGLLDSNIVLDDGNGNRATGRCTTDLVTWIGLCTFSDGVGTLAGFHARLDVSLKSLELGTFNLRGVYHFTRLGHDPDHR